MKTFSIILLLSGGLFFSAYAQDNSYVPNARQAVQRSRMQQPQYLELIKDSDIKQQGEVQTTPDVKQINYQVQRPVAIDAPKRRGDKIGESSFAKLANYSKR